MNSLNVLTDRTGRAFAALSFRDREVLIHRFGLGVGGYSYMTAEIGIIWKKDARWGRRAVASALRKLAAKDPGLTPDELRVLHAASCTVPHASMYFTI